MLSTEPLPHLGGNHFGAGGAAAVAGHDGAALHTDDVSLSIDHSLHHRQAFVAEFLNFGLHMDAVVIMYLCTEVDIVVDYHNGEVALLWRQAAFGEEGLLAEVEVFHDDGVVDVPHLVHVVEAYLYRCCVHSCILLACKDTKKYTTAAP